ncbi:MAG TPA: hypothetical protein VG165_01645 [Solirubrobacteraceae bacterium]|nr:hypothetical protein [Solirubrobacteraceae bacterium]
MLRRVLSLVGRAVLAALIVFAPLLVLIVVFRLFPSAADGLGGLWALYPLWWLLSMMLVPAVLFRDRGDGPGPPPPSDDDGGTGPPRRPSPRGAPRGGLPLPDADQARWRVRDQHGPDRRHLPSRRRSREPEHAPLTPLAPGRRSRQPRGGPASPWTPSA